MKLEEKNKSRMEELSNAIKEKQQDINDEIVPGAYFYDTELVNQLREDIEQMQNEYNQLEEIPTMEKVNADIEDIESKLEEIQEEFNEYSGAYFMTEDMQELEEERKNLLEELEDRKETKEIIEEIEKNEKELESLREEEKDYIGAYFIPEELLNEIKEKEEKIEELEGKLINKKTKTTQADLENKKEEKQQQNEKQEEKKQEEPKEVKDNDDIIVPKVTQKDYDNIKEMKNHTVEINNRQPINTMDENINEVISEKGQQRHESETQNKEETALVKETFWGKTKRLFKKLVDFLKKTDYKRNNQSKNNVEVEKEEKTNTEKAKPNKFREDLRYDIKKDENILDQENNQKDENNLEQLNNQEKTNDDDFDILM